MMLIIGMMAVFVWSEMVYDGHYREHCDQHITQLLQVLYFIIALHVFQREIVRLLLCFNPTTGERPPCRVTWFRRATLAAALLWPAVGIFMLVRAKHCSHALERVVLVIVVYYAIVLLVAVVFPVGFISVLALLIRHGLVRAPRSRNAAPEFFVDTLQKVKYDAARFGDGGDTFSSACPICLEPFAEDLEQSISIAPCTAGTHAFHTECLRGWLHCARTCPLCRQDLTEASAPGADV